MRVFVTGVGGQLGHDVMNELHKRGYEGVGSDLASAYSGIQDGSAVILLRSRKAIRSTVKASVFTHPLRSSEVQKPDLPLLREHDIGGFQVQVKDRTFSGMQILQCAAQFQSSRGSLFRRQMPFSLSQLFQVPAPDILHDHEDAV